MQDIRCRDKFADHQSSPALSIATADLPEDTGSAGCSRRESQGAQGRQLADLPVVSSQFDVFNGEHSSWHGPRALYRLPSVGLRASSLSDARATSPQLTAASLRLQSPASTARRPELAPAKAGPASDGSRPCQQHQHAGLPYLATMQPEPVTDTHAGSNHASARYGNQQRVAGFVTSVLDITPTWRCHALADAGDGSPLAQARAQERMLMEATDRWHAVTAHHAVTEQLKSKLWETELQVILQRVHLRRPLVASSLSGARP